MTLLVFTLLVFTALGVFFLFIHMMMGKMIRPNKVETDKLTIYECGEPTVGSAWIQFDLRYYVVALLFVIFDVEVAFFFPWAVVFGQATQLSHDNLTREERIAASKALNPTGIPILPGEVTTDEISPETAKSFAWLAVIDIGIFFGVLLMGFAYLWRRGDINWVRSTANAAPVEEGLETPGAYAPELASEQLTSVT